MAVEKTFVITRISGVKIWSSAFYLCLLVCTEFPLVASQQGFLSIDCGSSRNYTDHTTGIFWQADSDYISTGTTSKCDSSLNSLQAVFNITNQLDTIRRFNDSRPNHSRDCYTLPTTPQQKYIIRPTFTSFCGIDFVPANNTGSEFDVYLNSTFVRNIQINYYSTLFYVPIEIIFESPGSFVSLCLVRKTGESSITSLELRELKSGMYNAVNTSPNGEAVLLDTVIRATFGSDQDYYRYPDDPYDRYWLGYDNSLNIFRNLSEVKNRSSVLPSSSAQAPDLPPVSVMKQAFVSNNSKPITFTVYGPTGATFIAAYFQELDGNASAANVRGMDLLLNGRRISGSFSSSNQALQVQGRIPDRGSSELNITVAQASGSRLPPLLNAMELYIMTNVNKSRTAREDVDAVSALTTRIPQLPKWEGDPCLPVPFFWLNCAADSVSSTNFRITGLTLDHMNISGSIPQEIFLLGGLSALSLSENNISGSIPNLSKLSRLQSLSLRNNNLKGDIQNLSSLVNLQNLDLQNNSFTGGIPSFFSSFPNLTQLHVDNNNFSGYIPADVRSKMALNFTHTNNPGLKVKGPSSRLSTGVVVGIIFGSLFVLLIFATITWCLLTRKKRSTAKILREIHNAGSESLLQKTSQFQPAGSGHFGSLRVFTLQQVSEATEKFSKKLGEGSFGSVFYGKLPSGQEVAVKVKKEASHQGLPEFRNELELLSRIHHRNLVPLVGYCEEALQQILLYAYLPNGTLEAYLHGNKSETKAAPSWRIRLNIAVNSATGLEYLHFHCNPKIIHRDVKSANILLDEKFVAKVSDFGISKQTLEGMTSGVDTAVKGTFGYMDPELLITERLTRSNDVYSFGIVLLEIISGCHPRPMQLGNGTTIALVEWVRNCVRDGTAFDVFDPAMENKFSYQSARMVLDLALQCSNAVMSKRPDMRQVVRTLAQAEQLEDLEQPRLSASEDLAEVHRANGPNSGELQSDDYTSGRFSTAIDLEPSTQTSRDTVLNDTIDVEAR